MLSSYIIFLKKYKKQWNLLKEQILLELKGFGFMSDFFTYKPVFFFIIGFTLFIRYVDFSIFYLGVLPLRINFLIYIIVYSLLAFLILMEAVYTFYVIYKLYIKKRMDKEPILYPKFTFFLLGLRNVIPFILGLLMCFFALCFFLEFVVSSLIVVYDVRGGLHRGSFIRAFHKYFNKTNSIDDLWEELKNPELGAQKSALHANELYKKLEHVKKVK